MSWEEMRVEKHKCPCGKGIYSVTHLMDDWNRSEDKWEMNCNVCKEKYTLFQYPVFDSGMHTSRAGWVKKSLLNKIKRIEKDLNVLSEKGIEIFINRYKTEWLRYFRDQKSKKKIWGRLNNYELNTGSLSTFYSHVKDYGLDNHLVSYIKFHNLQRILEMLKISDQDLFEKICEHKILQNKYDKDYRKLQKTMFY